MTFQKNTFMWIFIALASIILICQIISLVVLFNTPAKIESNVNKIEHSANKLDSKLDTLNNLNNRVSNIESNLIILTNKYPPNQTININNMNQQELNRIINNAINAEFENVKWKIDLNLILNIAFGSLISFSFIIWLFGRKR